MHDAEPESEESLIAFLREMTSYDPEGEYYALSLGMDHSGKMYWGSQTHWVGWSKRRTGWEIREASLVSPEIMTKLWNNAGRRWVAVHTFEHLYYFLRLGGDALVAKSLADKHLPDVVGPSECLKDGGHVHVGRGFIETSGLTDEEVTRRAPSRKLRGRVMKRDGRKCRICGRSPMNYTDVELEVHHIIPWHMGGPTSEENLVTLCGTCHDGLDPHYDPDLRRIAKLPHAVEGLDGCRDEHRADVERYRDRIEEIGLVQFGFPAGWGRS